MRVAMCRNNRYYPVTIDIVDICPICGKEREDSKPYYFYEDGEWFAVDIWENSCGHADMYKDVLIEWGYAVEK